MNILTELLSFKNTDESVQVRKKATPSVISSAYTSIEAELNSLREFDSGKKEINAPDIRNSLRSIRRAL